MKSLLLISLALGLTIACSQKSVRNQGYSGLGLESVSKDDLKKYAPGDLDPSTEKQIREMLDINSPGTGLLHPNKEQLFFTWKITGVYQIWSLNKKQNFPIQLTGGKDSTLLVDITPDGKWLIVSQDKDGQENPGLFLLRPDGSKQVTVFSQNKVKARLMHISDDAKTLIYSANDEKPDSFIFYSYDIASGKRERIFAETGIWDIADVAKDGRWLMAKFISNSHVEYYEYQPQTQKLVTLFGQGESEDYQAIYAQNEKDLIVRTSKFSDFSKLYLVRSGQWKEIFSTPAGSVESVQMDRRRQRILISTNENAYYRLHALSATTLKPLKVPSFKGADHIFPGSTSYDGKVTMMGITTSKSPRTSYSYNWDTQKLHQWVYPSAPGINLEKFAVSKLEFYPTRDGKQIPMFVRRPADCDKKLCPVIVHFHGGPEGQSLPGFNTRAQIFVDAGFIYVDPNVRGSDGYGKKWLHSDNGAKRLDVITDIEDCAKFIKSEWKVKGQSPQVGVTGGSYGGYSTLMAMTRFAGSYDAGIAVVGMSNLVTFLQNTAPYRRPLREAEYGYLDKDHNALVKLSPVTYIDQVKSPLMIIQGVNDPRVPAGEAIQIQKLLESKKIPSSLILFADEGHGAEKKDNQVLQIGHMLEFFKKHLQ